MLALRDALAARGLPLGGSERAWASMPHDGMRVLADLVGPGQSVWRLPLVPASGPPVVVNAISDRGAAATLFSDR